jgi:hypothetical protein
MEIKNIFLPFFQVILSPMLRTLTDTIDKALPGG